jgi:hypothetical protein
MFAMKKILLLVALSFGNCFAGDIIQTSGGEYAGYINGRMIITASGSYGGVILNERMIVTPESSYGGFVTGEGVVIGAPSNTAGFISNWDDRDVK